MKELEAAVQMKLYTLSKRQFVIVFATFFTFFALSVVVGLLEPSVILSSSLTTSSPHNFSSLEESGKLYILHSPLVSRMNQQFWLVAKLFLGVNKHGAFQEPFRVKLNISASLSPSDSPDETIALPSNNHTKMLRCEEDTENSGTMHCANIILLHLRFIDYPYYKFAVHFCDLDLLSESSAKLSLMFKTYNPSFTHLEIWLRFVFLLLTFIATVMFVHQLRRFRFRDWSIEQKWITILLPLLLLYNDPLWPLTFLVDSWIPIFVDGIFQATFLCALLLFWLCTFHGIRVTRRRFRYFYLPKLILVSSIWIICLFSTTVQGYYEISDPTYSISPDKAIILKIIFFSLCGIYILYLLFLIIRSFAELYSMPYFDIRLKVATGLMLVVFIVSIVILSLRFGTASAFEPNFQLGLATHYSNAAEFLSFYGLLNFYLFTLAYIYSPAPNAIFESHFRDNPAISMLNDSEDDDNLFTSLHRGHHTLDSESSDEDSIFAHTTDTTPIRG